MYMIFLCVVVVIFVIFILKCGKAIKDIIANSLNYV